MVRKQVALRAEVEEVAILSVLMPAYEEAERIEASVAETTAVLSRFEIEHEIIVIDDGSSDGTHIAASRAVVESRGTVRLVRCLTNRGKGGALQAGIRVARGEYIAFLDADIELHPEQIPLFLGIMEANGVDIVVGSKWHPLSQIQSTRLRRFYSLGFFTLAKCLFGLPVRDTQTGLKLFRADVLRMIGPRLVVKRYAFDLELLAVAHRFGFTMAEAPVTVVTRRLGNRIALRDVRRMVQDSLAIAYRMKLLCWYDRERAWTHDADVLAPTAVDEPLSTMQPTESGR